ncbi:MAG TPA: hypothetical protein VGB57_04680 [Allosphingosinicella sp.]|jgi:hypothetical protein
MNIGTTLVAALLAPAPAASPPVETALASAARYCETVVTEKNVAPPLPAGATVEPEGGVPDLVKRFAATQSMVSMFGVGAFAHFRARNGQVWVIRSPQPAVCHIMVTAVPGGSAALGASFTKSLAGQGWQTVSSIPASAAMPLWRHKVAKWVSKPNSPNFGLLLDVQGLLPPSSTEDGVQMELSFIGGNNLQVGSSRR